jgi:hypothetical protein
MNETELKTLWDKLQGKLNVGTFESFKNKMSTQEKRKRFFDKFFQKLKDDFNFTLGNYNDFERRLTLTSTNTQLKYSGCPEVHPVKYGCKNNLVKTFQRCLGVKDDGKFGPITRQKMKDLGLSGDVITAKERIAVCSRLDPVTPETQNLGYEDYTNDEYEDSSEKPEQEYSTGYEDYTLEEN